MANPNSQLAQTINQTLRAYYQEFQRKYPDGVGLAKMAEGRQIMEDKFTGVLQNCQPQYLRNKEFQQTINDTTGMEPIDSAMFHQSVAEVFRRLGLGI